MAFKTIVLKGVPLRKEKMVVTGEITPGMLIERTSADKVMPHDTAGGDATPKLFAIENPPDEIGHAYAVGEQCQFVAARPGDEIFALLADDEEISIGEQLESHGDGMLKAYVPASGEPDYYERIVGIALEAVDTTSSTYEAGTRIHIEVV